MVEDASCTSKACQWIEPSLRPVEYARVKDIDFTSPGKKLSGRKRVAAEKVQFKPVAPPSTAELDNFYQDLAAGVRKPSILSIVPAHCKKYIPSRPPGLPSTLASLYDYEILKANCSQLIEHCQSCFDAVKISAEEAKAVEEATRKQAEAKQWFAFRAGRITASKLKAATRTDIAQPSTSLIRSICYPEAFKFTSVETRWGCEHERHALTQYAEYVGTCHQHAKMCGSGLVIHPDHPYLGASRIQRSFAHAVAQEL